MRRETLNALLKDYGEKYSRVLGIDLSEAKDEEVFEWFLASMLFGAPITESSVLKTYKCFQKHNVLTPQRIIETGWEELVRILDEGSYTRYDFKTADKLLEVSRSLVEKYDGSLNLLHEKTLDAQDLEKRLKDLGKGVGNVTVSIFLRELRDVWKKSKPNPTDLVILAAKNLGIIKDQRPENALQTLETFWTKNKVEGKSFIEFETALVRLGKELRRKTRHPFPDYDILAFGLTDKYPK
ncbi:MAG TPA: hypothetical protein VMT26_02030 [Candidatus Bathyarchaeia archaeon]|nr:hypothetical protein [Candidatus Bathyarchaeia archaeon]